MLTHLFKVTFNDTQPTYQVTSMPYTVYISNITLLAEMFQTDKAINQCHISVRSINKEKGTQIFGIWGRYCDEKTKVCLATSTRPTNLRASSGSVLQHEGRIQ